MCVLPGVSHQGLCDVAADANFDYLVMVKSLWFSTIRVQFVPLLFISTRKRTLRLCK